MSAQHESWSERVVDRLAALKMTGCTKERAWAIVMREYPPRLRDLGPEVPTLFLDEESVVDFFQRACFDAWSGDRPHLRYLHTALQDLAAEPSSVPARRRARATAV